MRIPIIKDLCAGAWEDGAEAYGDWVMNQSTPSGRSIDPPLNPFD